MTAPPVPPTVIMFATADWRERYWTNKQHIALRLAERGAQVLYIESTGFRRPGLNPRDISRIADRLKRARRSPEQVGERLWVHAPLVIPAGHRLTSIRGVNGHLLRSAIRRWLRRHGTGPVTVWTYHPYYVEAVRGLQPAALVYHCVDDIAAMPGVDGETFAAAERRLLEQADVIFTTSPKLEEHCRTIAGDRVVYERNVADIEHFATARTSAPEPPDLADIPHPRAGYVGVLSDFKLDLPLLLETARRRPEWHIVLIGEEPERQNSPQVAALAALPNVHLLGYRPYDALPDYLRAIDVALLPNLTAGYMASVFPMKFYEYLAAGRPIISTNLPALAEVSDVATITENPEEWETAIAAAIASPGPPLPLDDERLRAFSWTSRLDRMLARIAQVSGRGGDSPLRLV